VAWLSSCFLREANITKGRYRMKRIILTLFFLLLGTSSNALIAGGFTKHGDNGHASCEQFCAGDKWKWKGGVGACVSAYDNLHKVSVGCDVKPGYLNGQELTCQCESGKLPIRASQRDTVGSHWYMETDVTVSQSGLISANTNTKSCQKDGFTGGVWVALIDEDSNVIHITQVQSFGINGKSPGGGCNSRGAPWSENVPANLLSKLGGIVILQRHSPNIRVNKGDVENAIKLGVAIYTAQ